jgi:7,8-dihydro-6-hydroxymethylpterin-pyrophosphokinase
MYGDQVISDSVARLEIPDPDILTTSHIALPLADLEPNMLHPLEGRSLKEIADALVGGPVVRPVAGMVLDRR